jgi:hypothetical protein
MSRLSGRERAQQMSRVYAVMTCLLIVNVAQLVLLMVGVESYWRGQIQVLLASTLASAAALGGAAWLVRYILPGFAGTGRSRREDR